MAPNLACGVCTYCRIGRPNQCENFATLGIFLDGGFAEYNVAPAKALYPIAKDLPLEEAVFVESLSCVLGGTEKVRIQPGETTVIVGAGPIGLLFILVFKAAGAKVISTEVVPFRLEFAKKAGAASSTGGGTSPARISRSCFAPCCAGSRGSTTSTAARGGRPTSGLWWRRRRRWRRP